MFFKINTKRILFKLQAQIIYLDKDILIIITGGKEHLGSIAAAVPRNSLSNINKLSSTASTFSFIGHKEDELVKLISEYLSAKFNKKIVVIAGIHWNNITQKELIVIKKRSIELINLIENILKRFNIF